MQLGHDAPSERCRRSPVAVTLEYSASSNLEGLGEVIGTIRKRHPSHFVHSVFQHRDKQLQGRDLLVAYVPTRKKGGRRAIGILRRSLRYDKKRNCSTLFIDFVWVMPEFRGCSVGTQMLSVGLLAGKAKDVRLHVAGSEDNVAAVRAYAGLGFSWASDTPCAPSGVDLDGQRTEMVLEAERVVETCEAAAARTAALLVGATQPTVGTATSSTRAGAACSLGVVPGREVSLTVRLPHTATASSDTAATASSDTAATDARATADTPMHAAGAVEVAEKAQSSALHQRHRAWTYRRPRPAAAAMERRSG